MRQGQHSAYGNLTAMVKSSLAEVLADTEKEAGWMQLLHRMGRGFMGLPHLHKPPVESGINW